MGRDGAVEAAKEIGGMEIIYTAPTKPTAEEEMHGLGSAADHVVQKLHAIVDRHPTVFAELMRFVEKSLLLQEKKWILTGKGKTSRRTSQVLRSPTSSWRSRAAASPVRRHRHSALR